MPDVPRSTESLADTDAKPPENGTSLNVAGRKTRAELYALLDRGLSADQQAALREITEVHKKEGITDEQYVDILEALLRIKPELWEDIQFYLGKIPGPTDMMKGFYVPVLRGFPLHRQLSKQTFVHEMNHHFWFEKLSPEEQEMVKAFHRTLEPADIVRTLYTVNGGAHFKSYEWLAQAYATWFYKMRPWYDALMEEKFAPIIRLFESFERQNLSEE
jgi:hypothetical protein